MDKNGFVQAHLQLQLKNAWESKELNQLALDFEGFQETGVSSGTSVRRFIIKPKKDELTFHSAYLKIITKRSDVLPNKRLETVIPWSRVCSFNASYDVEEEKKESKISPDNPVQAEPGIPPGGPNR
jgi:hypothetical protein